MKKDQPNKGWINEIASKPKPTESKQSFTYSKPVNKVDRTKPISFNLKQREHKTPSSNLKTELKKGK